MTKDLDTRLERHIVWEKLLYFNIFKNFVKNAK